jgi:hypothetical protein
MSTATLTWTNPTTRTDGSPLAPEDIAWVDVYDNGADIMSIGGAATSATTGNLTVGSHKFSVVVHDNKGQQSAQSNISTVNIFPVVGAPNAVTDLSAVVNL